MIRPNNDDDIYDKCDDGEPDKTSAAAAAEASRSSSHHRLAHLYRMHRTQRRHQQTIVVVVVVVAFVDVEVVGRWWRLQLDRRLDRRPVTRQDCAEPLPDASLDSYLYAVGRNQLQPTGRVQSLIQTISAWCHLI